MVREVSKGGQNANCIISIRTCNGPLRARGHHKGIRLSLNVCTWKLALEDVARARHYKYIAPMIRRSWLPPQTKFTLQGWLTFVYWRPSIFHGRTLLPTRAYLNSFSPEISRDWYLLTREQIEECLFILLNLAISIHNISSEFQQKLYGTDNFGNDCFN